MADTQPAAPPPVDTSAQPVNTSHAMSTAGITALLSVALMYLTHWPLTSMDDNTADAFAGLIVICGAPVLKWCLKRRAPPSSVHPNVTTD